MLKVVVEVEVNRQSVSISSSSWIQDTVLHPSDKDNVGALEVGGTEEDVSYRGNKGSVPQVRTVSWYR
jgi:hypothetical protein